MDKPRRIPNFRLERMDDELLLLDPARTTILYCNDTAALIWELCDGQRAAPAIIARLIEMYPESADAIPADVHATIKRFHENGAVEYV